MTSNRLSQLRSLGRCLAGLGAALALLWPALPAGAEASPQVGKTALGMGAVGRLDFGPSAFCTGALIAPDLVLTAAHCLFDPQGQPYPPEEVLYRAGQRDGRALGEISARALLPHPQYRPPAPMLVAEAMPESSAADASAPRIHDLALVVLDAPVTDPRARPFLQAPAPPPGAKVAVVSYAHDRRDLPLIESACHMLEQQSGLLVLNCQVDFGASGAPVLIRQAVEWRLVSVITAKAEDQGRAVSLGVRLDQVLAELLHLAGRGLPADAAVPQPRLTGPNRD